MSSWIHIADDGKHAIYRCWGCKALGVAKIGEGYTLGKCCICASGGRRK